MDKKSFDGYTVNYGIDGNIEDKFDDIGADSLVYVSKEEFEHEEEGLTFNYRYIIEVLDMEYLTGDADAGTVITLDMVVSPKNLHEDIAEDIKYTFGLEDEEDVKISYYDVKESGLGIQFASEELDGYDEEVIKDKLNTLSEVFESLDSMRGFYLDRAWNRIGTNGWDTLYHAVYNKNLFTF